jgi:putative endonuclease
MSQAGRRSEIHAALWLIAGANRSLGLRMRTRQGAIDLRVSRGDDQAAVEVKQSRAFELALEAARSAQRQKLRLALSTFAARRARKDARIRLILMALAPGRFPRHIPGAWSEDGDQP